MSAQAPRVSLCMIVRNERGQLARCLDSVRGLADEVIVVDTGSTDGTPELARTLGAIVVETTWRDDFAEARNRALSLARGAWILVLDGDEWLPPESVAAVRALAAREPAEAFHLIQCSEDPEGHPMHAAAVRLFPNRPDVRYRFPLHEEVNESLKRAGVPLRGTAVEIRHSGYADPSEIARKQERNRRIVEAALARKPEAEEELHLRYFRGCFAFDAQQWGAAAEDYAWCVEAAPLWRHQMMDTVRLRLAECHLELRDWTRARALLPAAPVPTEHPLALALQARIARASGDAGEARRWYQALLAVREGIFSPPVALGALRAKAAEFLAGAGLGRE